MTSEQRHRQLGEDTMKVLLEEPECKYGYTMEQLHRVLDAAYDEYWAWARGSTGLICDGREWNPMSQEFVDTGCGPHGVVVFPWDVRSFLIGRRGA